MGTILTFNNKPSLILILGFIILNQGCFFICLIVNLFSGSVFNILRNISLQFSLKNLGISNLPLVIFLYNFSLSSSSKGKYPHNIA